MILDCYNVYIIKRNWYRRLSLVHQGLLRLEGPHPMGVGVGGGGTKQAQACELERGREKDIECESDPPFS